MNKDNMNKVIKAIEEHPNHFSMTTVFCRGAEADVPPEDWGCGAAACVLGWAKTIMFQETRRNQEDDEVYTWLGLTYDEGHLLCFPNEDPAYESVWLTGFDPYRMTAERAVRRLRELVEQDWGGGS